MMDVSCVLLRSCSLNPIRYSFSDDHKRLWKIESSGWWQEKFPGQVSLQEAWALLGDCQLDVRAQWDSQAPAALPLQPQWSQWDAPAPSASASLHWQ